MITRSPDQSGPSRNTGRDPGLSDVPAAGDILYAVDEERQPARSLRNVLRKSGRLKMLLPKR